MPSADYEPRAAADADAEPTRCADMPSAAAIAATLLFSYASRHDMSEPAAMSRIRDAETPSDEEPTPMPPLYASRAPRRAERAPPSR